MISDILKNMMDRRSIRRYSSKKVLDEIIETILHAAIWAPSAHNAQPWSFIVIQDSILKEKLAKDMSKEWEKDLRKDGMVLEDRENLTNKSIRQFTQPPVIVIACLMMRYMNRYQDTKRIEAEYQMGIQSVAAAIQNLLLAASSLGVGSCWFCAPLFCQDTVRNVLNIPQDVEPVALITLGYPNENPVPPVRKPLKSVVHQNYWGEKSVYGSSRGSGRS